MQRDQNSALVVLIDAHTPGTGVAARPKPLVRQRAKSKSATRETPLQRHKAISGGKVHSKELANGKFVFVPRVPGRKGSRKQHTTALEALSTPLRW
jgi:hypothetical protein